MKKEGGRQPSPAAYEGALAWFAVSLEKLSKALDSRSKGSKSTQSAARKEADHLSG